MANRRSLGDAMTMTPEKVAFIHGSAVKDQKAEAVRKVTPVPETTIELESPVAVPPGENTATRQPRARRRRQAKEQPQATEILDQMLVPVTIRLQRKTAQALKRAHLEQRLNQAKPDTQQEIVEEALGDWLAGRGLLD